MENKITSENQKLISTLDEGFDDPTQKEIENIKKEFSEYRKSGLSKDDFEKGMNPLLLLTIICVWILFFRYSINYGFGTVYFLFSIIGFIFFNLSDRKRKPWELSAYSIFNRNGERLFGHMSINDIQPGLVREKNNEDFNNKIDKNNEDEIEKVDRNRALEELNRLNNINYYNVDYRNKIEYETKFEKKKSQLKENADQPLNSECSCGSQKKYKKCCLLKKLE